MVIGKEYWKRCLSLIFFILALFIAFDADADTIIDNRDAATSRTGSWYSSLGTGSYGADSLFGRSGVTFTWLFSPSESGTHEVSMWWTYRDSRSTNIPVDIEHAGGTTRVFINQKQVAGGGIWNVLGTYSFVAGATYSITITAQPYPDSSSTTCADAVKFAFLSGGGNMPPAATIDSITPNPALPGQMVTFSGNGTDSDGSIAAYEWRSSIDGLLDTRNTFTTSLAAGTHTISLRVQDNEGSWSEPVTQVVVVGIPAAETVIDNRDAATSRTGSWYSSLGAGSYGVDSVFARNGATFTWLFSPSQSGTHEVSMWWTYRDSRSTNIPVDIEYAGGATRVFVNQKEAAGGGIWNVLGSYDFEAGGSYGITITAQPYPNSSSTTCADAVKFAYLSGGGNMPPAATIDSITPNPALPGQMVTFTGHGTDSDGSIAAYEWRSSIDGLLDTRNTFTASLAEGTHTISLRVQDNEGSWSTAASMTLQVSGQTSNTEHVYVGPLYDSAPSMYSGVLQGLGATRDGETWRYSNPANKKTYIVHFLDTLDETRQAMYTEDSVIILQGHSNYGLGGVYSTAQENLEDAVYDLYYMDDDRLLNWSSPWVPLSVRSCIRSHAFPNWYPIFKDGTSAVMPYVHGDPQGDPPYNYYITYQVPGDPTYYRVGAVPNSALQRFPDCGSPAWYSPNGATPSPSNPAHLQYYITNTDTTPVTSMCGTRICPRAHYGSKTIVFRKENEIDKNRLRYKRMLYASCTTGVYYLDTFQHGIMFYTTKGIGGTASTTFLRAYLQGRSDQEIWELMQDVEPGYDYYNFDRRPSEQ